MSAGVNDKKDSLPNRRDPQEVAVRVAAHADLGALVRFAALFRDHSQRTRPSAEEFRSGIARLLDDPGTEFLLALDESGAPLGFAQLRFRFSAWLAGNAAEVEDLYVLREARRHGVGRRLMELAIDRARGRSCQMIGLNTNERNGPALALYEGLGFGAASAFWKGGRRLWLQRSLEP